MALSIFLKIFVEVFALSSIIAAAKNKTSYFKLELQGTPQIIIVIPLYLVHWECCPKQIW